MNTDGHRKRRRRGSSDEASSPLVGALDHERGDDQTVSQLDGCHARQVYKHSRVEGNARVHFGNQHIRHEYHGPVHQGTDAGLSSGSQPSLGQMFMEQLYFDEIDHRHDNIKIHGKTCRWLLQRKEYLDWQDQSKVPEHRGFLWIKGKAGTGKSTTMKYIYAHAQKELQGEIVIRYFFTARGTELEKSVDGMFRSLLYQTLEKLPNRDSMFELLQSHGYKLRTLNMEVLKEIFKLVIENLGQQRLTCFIDALDETDDDEVQDMIGFFEDLGESAALANVHLNVCFSSRHYPQITIKQCQSLVLEDRDEHHANIEKYVKKELSIGQSKTAISIKAEIQRRASGIFLWVVLVVELLNKAYRHGQVHILRECLHNLPDKLDDLFRMLILRDNRNTAQLVLTLQCILYAKRPLKREELYFAIQARENTYAPTPWDQDELSLEDMERFILDCSKGLVEVTRAGSKTIQLIHESVRSFLLQETGLPELDPQLAGNIAGLSHDALKRCCQNCLLVPIPTLLPDPSTKGDVARLREEARLRTLNTFPFLQYALSGLLHHANLAQSHGVSQHDFVQAFSLGKWIALHNMFQKGKIRRHDCSTTKAYVLADQDATHLLEIEIKDNPNFNAQTAGSFKTPLGVAVSRNNERNVELLLRRGANPISKATSSSSILNLAIKRGYANIVRTLVKHGANLPADPKKQTHHLDLLISGGHIDILKILLDHGVNASVIAGNPEFEDYTPLEAAAIAGRADIAELLISRGSNVNGRGFVHGSMLHAASCSGQVAIVELLLNHHANCESEKKLTERFCTWRR